MPCPPPGAGDHTYEKVFVPPDATTLADPLLTPQFAFTDDGTKVIAVVWLMLTVVVAVHPCESVTVTLYVPIPKPVILNVPPEAAISVPTGLPVVVPVQLTLYGAVPPEPVINPEPVKPPLQTTFVSISEAVSKVGCVIGTVAVAVHPFADVKVIVYEPAGKPVILKVPPEAAISVPTGFPVVVPIQLTLYPAVAPEPVTTIDPVEPPLQATCVGNVEIVGFAFTVIFKVSTLVQVPLETVNVTVEVPAAL